MTEFVFIGLGSNLDNPAQQVNRAIATLAGLPQSNLIKHSSMYRSPPMDGTNQPDYINAVAMLESTLNAETLLDRLLHIENQHGRVREQRWGPRTLDLDILMFGQQIIDSDRLQVPHPGLGDRGFVLEPWYEIAPTTVIPGVGKLETVRARLGDSGVRRL
ncbi:MAG: 2-amino-4-hydroxy-6-hydroxymethyldihydropteridine diphosphokinase [bacterium]